MLTIILVYTYMWCLCARASSYFVVLVAELFHQVFGDPLADVGLVVSHAIFRVQADASHTPLPVCGVLQQPVVLCQVVHWVAVGSMDPGGSELQSCISYKQRKDKRMRSL